MFHLALLYCSTLLTWCKRLLFEPIRQKTLRPKLTAAEGMILGTAAKMFTIAGPVIVYGVAASVFYGLIYWLLLTFS